MACSFSDEIVSKTTSEFEKWQEKNTSDIIVLVEVLSFAIYYVFIDGVVWAKIPLSILTFMKISCFNFLAILRKT